MIEIQFARVSFLQFWATIGILGLVIFFVALYMTIFVWHFGKPMRKYLKARLTPGMGIIQQYEHENVDLHVADVKDGEFTDLEDEGYVSVEKLPRKWYQIWKPKTKTVIHKLKPQISKSTLSIAGVQTLLSWNVNPKLPERYTGALNSLISLGYNNINEITASAAGKLETVTKILQESGYSTPDDIKQDIKDRIIKASEVIEGTDVTYSEYLKLIHKKNNTSKISLKDVIPNTNMTYEEFLTLHEKIANRNSIFVSPDDVLNFETKYLDEHPRKSIVEKTVTAESKRVMEKKYQKYAFIIMAITIIGGFLLIAWKIQTVKGG